MYPLETHPQTHLGGMPLPPVQAILKPSSLTIKINRLNLKGGSLYLGFMVLDISTQSWMDPLLWAQKRQMIGRQESEKKTLLVLLTEKR